jgi:thiamine-phosphate pyrophosphorylase
MPAVARILDANVNRAREAMRVMEDAARFALNNASLCEELKNLRHEFRAVVDALQPSGGGWLEANRDVSGDVGTSISTATELNRRTLLDVVIAAGKRLTESLRVIEEISKMSISPAHAAGSLDHDQRTAALSSRLESLRYRAYELDAQLQLRFGSGRAAQWAVCIVLTRSLCKGPWQKVLREAVAAGADCVQVREKNIDAGELVRHVREVMDIAKPHAAVIVNDRMDIALAAGADGVHLGQDDLSIRDVRRIAGRSLIVGASAHDLEEARAAVEAGADYCGVGTMFASIVKPEREPTGPEFLRLFIEQFPHTPHLAIGGVTPASIEVLAMTGCRGVAVSSAICAAPDPGWVVQVLRDALSAPRGLSAATA